MKFLLLVVLLIGIAFLFLRSRPTDGLTPAEIAKRVADGRAVLIDVREPAEWTAGVAAPALLLPLSDLRGERRSWAPVLAKHRDKELILYCRSGNRSGQAASILAGEGFRTANGGSFARWASSGELVRNP
jgi:rhodanese-related sulfurtransferase